MCIAHELSEYYILFCGNQVVTTISYYQAVQLGLRQLLVQSNCIARLWYERSDLWVEHRTLEAALSEARFISHLLPRVAVAAAHLARCGTSEQQGTR
jgi:hypothetical protein